VSNPQEQYTEVLQSSQQAVIGALDSMSKAAQQAFSVVPNAPIAPVDPTEVIDQVFDFAGQLLESQRAFAKSLTQASNQMGDNLRTQAENAAQQAGDVVAKGRKRQPAAS
jgi:acetyl-CoA carboxylase carboxyltransferase component